MNSTNILWNLFKERVDHARQHANQRATVTNFFLAIASALLAFAARDGLEMNDLPITSFLIVIGFYGYRFSTKHYLENRRHIHYANKYKEKMAELLLEDEIDLNRMEMEAKKEFELQYENFKAGNLNKYWKGINTIIWLLGIILTLIIFMEGFFMN